MSSFYGKQEIQHHWQKCQRKRRYELPIDVAKGPTNAEPKEQGDMSDWPTDSR
jgi:hypothetical protein